MSDVATALSAPRDGAVPPPKTYRMLGRVRWLGYGLLCLELAGYLVWSTFEYQRFSLAGDYSSYAQAWSQVAHGNLDPLGTVAAYPHFWQGDAEFMPYVLAPLYWVFHSSLVLQWVQDLSVVGAEIVAFTWLCGLARRQCAERDAAWLAGLGLLLLAVNPWIMWTLSFDVHEESLVMFFAVFMAWDLSRVKRRALVWAVPVLLGGAPTTTYVLGIGLGGVLAGRQTRKLGAALAVMGLAYSAFLTAVHGNEAATYVARSCLKIASDDPLKLVQTLWDMRADIIANVAPAGLLGIGAPLIAPLALAVIVPNTLTGYQFGEPLFQTVPVYLLLPVGTVAVLAWLLRSHRRAVFVLAGLIAAQAVGWAAVWGPRTPSQWMRVPSATATTLASLQGLIPASAEVIASEGVLGRFSTRARAYRIFNAGAKEPLLPGTWFVITPTSGIETVTTATSMALIGEVAGALHGKLITHANGVWAFQVTPPPGINSIEIPGSTSPIPAWAAAGIAGRAVLNGAESTWHTAATGARGYVANGIQWQIYRGEYNVNVTLSASAPVNVELWDDTTNTIVTRRTIQTDGVQQVELPLTVPAAPDASAFSGWGPFHADFVPPRAGQLIEVRVWSPGGVTVNIYSGDLTTASGAPVPANLVPDTPGLTPGFSQRNGYRSGP
jgi:hypothetical protein